jgi:type II secretory pathway component PulF
MYVPIGLLVFGGASRLALWFGGRRVQTQRAAAFALRTIQSLTSRGVSTNEAISISCNLVGNDRGVRQIVDRALQGRERDDVGVDELATAAEHLQIAADNRLATLKVLLPSAILISVGGTLVVIYCLALFWPVITLIRDLTFPGG